MLIGPRKPRPPADRRREKYHPACEPLETRAVPTTIDLVNIAGPALPPTPPPTLPLPTPSPATGPFGVLLTGAGGLEAAGFSVAVVGDVNGDTFEDFVVGAPVAAPVFTPIGPMPFGPGRAFLVFGSRRAGQVGNQITDFLRLLNVQGSTTPTVTTPRNERVGSLGTIGNANQGSPVGAGVEGFPFDGLVFVASQSQSGQVGASVAALGDVNRDGLADFAIGAPGAADATNAPNGAGRVYVIYGARNLPQRTIRPVDLDGPPTDPNGPTILTLVGTPGAGVGRSLAMLGDVITDGQVDLGIGAPFASGNQGAVFVVSGTFLGTPPTTTRPVLATVGQPGGIPGIQITGAQAGDLAGFALSTAGDVDNDASVDFVIGAPGANGGAGSAVLIFGAADLARRFPAFALNQIGPGVTSVPGVVFNGEPGDQAGFSVAAAGDPTIPQPGNRSFNADVFSDFLIGSPGFALGTGRVTAIYGRGRTPLPAGSPTPAFPLTPITLSNAGVASFGTNFLGATPGSRAGFSVSSTLDVDLDGLLEILIGAPGALNGQGQAYLIHGQAGLPATFNLGIVGAASNTRDVAFMDARASGLGAAVSGSLTRPTATIDSDTRGDFLIGAPTSTFFQQAGGSGAVYVLEGAFVLPPAQPGQPGTPADITFQILGVDAVGNFTVSATTPMTLRIFIPSNATLTPPFRPVTDIDLTTLMVNGVPIAGATIAADPIDENVDGIPDAILTIPNRAALNLTAATTTLTVTGRTLAVGTTPARTFTGTATIRVVGAPGTSNPAPGVSLPVDVNRLFPPPNAAVPPFGERLVPQRQILGKLRWKPIPVRRAYRQFLPTEGFARRFNSFFHPVDVDNPGGRNDRSQSGTSTLGRETFTRGRFKAGQIRFPRIDHGEPTIPPTP